ncbi:hypothetical protein ACHAQJ_002909 [Trichoderma viride]
MEEMTSQSSFFFPQSSGESQSPVKPCAFCSRAGVECLYPFTGRIPTRQHNQATASVASVRKAPARKQSELQVLELLGRLKKLESVVDGMKTRAQDGDSGPRHTNLRNSSPGNGELSSTVEREEAFSDAITTGPPHDRPYKLDRSFGSLHICESGTLYTGNGFLATLHSELKSVREAFETSDIFDSDSLDDGPSVYGIETDQMPFSSSQNVPPESVLHPTPKLMSFIWQVYVGNFSKESFDKMSMGMRALLFSISLAAIGSLNDADVQKTFGDAKEKVLSRFVLGTEQALSQAGILKSTELCVAQASLIYLETAGHRFGMRTVWMMSGILVRAAISIGLHRDGAAFSNISYFEAEMRRRLWWHICCFDARVSQCYAPETIISNNMMDTREPTNINDADLEVNMKTEPVARIGFTDVSFTLLTCELRRQSNHVLSLMSALLSTGEKKQVAQHEALRKIEEGREWAKTKIFENLGQKRAIASFAEFFFNLVLDHLSIIVRDANIFGKWSLNRETDCREQSFVSALVLIENMEGHRGHSSTCQWEWVLVNYQQWYAIGSILIHLQTQAWDSICERAWTLVVKTLNDIPPAMMTQNPLRQPIISMVTAARQHREEEVARLNVQLENSPKVSLLPGLSAPTSVAADRWSGFTSLDPLAATQGVPSDMAMPGSEATELLTMAPVDMLQNNTYQSSTLPEGMHSDFSYPPWYIEPTSDLAEPNLDDSQESYFYNLLGSRGIGSAVDSERFHLWPQSQFFGP